MTALSLAVGDLGYSESPPGSNRTKYGEWYGLNGVAWCMEAVQYWFYMAGTPLPYKTASCSDLLRWYRRNSPGSIVSEPMANDIVIYSFGHTGIVESVSADGSFTAIEGNTSAGSDANGGCVMRRTRPRSSVAGFIRAAKLAGASPRTTEKDFAAASGRTTEEYDKEALGEEKNMRYHTVDEIAAAYGDEARRLVLRGALRGRDGGDLDISEDMLRCLIICQRMVDGL